MADTTLKSVYVFTGFKGAGIAQWLERWTRD